MNLLDDTYIPIDCLVLMADGEYGYNVYCKGSDKEFSFFTSSEELDDIIEDIKLKMESE